MMQNIDKFLSNYIYREKRSRTLIYGLINKHSWHMNCSAIKLYAAKYIKFVWSMYVCMYVHTYCIPRLEEPRTPYWRAYSHILANTNWLGVPSDPMNMFQLHFKEDRLNGALTHGCSSHICLTHSSVPNTWTCSSSTSRKISRMEHTDWISCMYKGGKSPRNAHVPTPLPHF